MKSSISKKMDMVKNVFLNNKRLEEQLVSVNSFMLDNPHEIVLDDYYPERQLLNEGKSKKKVSNKKICRIKNNKGEFVDIRKIKKDDKDDSHLLELPPPDGDENLITIGNQMSIPETLNLLKRIKRGRVSFSDFVRKSEESFY